MFTGRREGGMRLLERLSLLDPENTVVLALPRGGLPVADVIATVPDGPPISITGIECECNQAICLESPQSFAQPWLEAGR